MTSTMKRSQINRDRLFIQLSRVVLVMTLVLGISAVILFYLNRHTPVPTSWSADGGARNNPGQWINIISASVIAPLVANILAVLIINRHPRQRVAWLLLCVFFLGPLQYTLAGWAVYGYFTSNGAIGQALAAWVTNWLWICLFTFNFMVLMIFPNGRFLSRPVQLTGLSLLGLFALPMMLAGMLETPLASAYQIPNPFASVPEQLTNILTAWGSLFVAPSFVFVLVAVLLRFLQSAGHERQQLKWLLLGVSLMVGQLGLGFSLENTPFKVIGDILVNNAFIWPLLGVGIALLRHNLYGVDLIIRRTLIYGVLTVILVGVYLSAVILLQRGFRALSGQESQLAVVLSTLIIAALFSPLRRRIQQLIDKRFYRRNYNAQKVLAEFALKTRDEVELDALTGELIQVVKNTMQPSHVSLWLKGDSK